VLFFFPGRRRRRIGWKKKKGRMKNTKTGTIIIKATAQIPPSRYVMETGGHDYAN
jgi:hypothetical protein